ncbi:MAG: hypothetical protein Phyf2KO_26550 [Phycisphaerales bacterium]
MRAAWRIVCGRVYALGVPENPDKKAVKDRSAVLSTVCWVAASLGVLFALNSWLPAVFAGAAAEGDLGLWFWAFDVLASLSAQGAYLMLVLCVLVVFLRRFGCGIAFALSLAVLVVLPHSEKRLSRAADTSSEVRVLVYNSHTYSDHVDEKHALLTEADVDVAVVLETSTGMMDSLIRGEGFRVSHPYGWLPNSKWSGCPAVMSRYPVEPAGSGLSGRLRVVRRDLWDHICRLEIVHAPGGSFALIQAHARSPRSASRWSAGLDQLLEFADIVRRVEELTGLPVVVAGDFNSPPTGVRARAFAIRSGLRRAKPATKLGGTFPAVAPVLLGLAIDGVYASPGVRVTSWEVVGSAGSDHRGVVVGLDFGETMRQSSSLP